MSSYEKHFIVRIIHVSLAFVVTKKMSSFSDRKSVV